MTDRAKSVMFGGELRSAMDDLATVASARRESGKAWTSPPEKTFHVGHYTLDSIDSTGNVVVGCHELPFDEMARVAPAAREAYTAQPVAG
jgi:hypothetical protein